MNQIGSDFDSNNHTQFLVQHYPVFDFANVCVCSLTCTA